MSRVYKIKRILLQLDTVKDMLEEMWKKAPYGEDYLEMSINQLAFHDHSSEWMLGYSMGLVVGAKNRDESFENIGKATKEVSKWAVDNIDKMVTKEELEDQTEDDTEEQPNLTRTLQ